MSKSEQYTQAAREWTERSYADAHSYLAHRAELIDTLGIRLSPGDEVLDLACGDGGLGEFLLARGLRYMGVDATPAMVEEARGRFGSRARIELGDLNDFVPTGAVAATTVFRAIYYARDRVGFFRHVLGFTERKLVFDLNPRQYPVDEVLADLRSAGYSEVALRPFFVPQTVSLGRPGLAVAKALEGAGPLARIALRFRFTYLVAASV